MNVLIRNIVFAVAAMTVCATTLAQNYAPITYSDLKNAAAAAGNSCKVLYKGNYWVFATDSQLTQGVSGSQLVTGYATYQGYREIQLIQGSFSVDPAVNYSTNGIAKGQAAFCLAGRRGYSCGAPTTYYFYVWPAAQGNKDFLNCSVKK